MAVSTFFWQTSVTKFIFCDDPMNVKKKKVSINIYSLCHQNLMLELKNYAENSKIALSGGAAMAAAINAGDGLGGRAGRPGLGHGLGGGGNFPGMEGLQVREEEKD